MISDQEFLLSLYRSARTLPTGAFQRFAIGALLPSRLRFGAATWGSGYLLGRDPAAGMVGIPSLSYGHETDPAGFAEWSAINREDRAIPIFFGAPFVTHALHTPTFFQAREDAVMRDYARRYGRQCVLGTALSGAGAAVAQWCSLFRPDADDLFDDEERRHCQWLVRHLAEALKVNQLVRLSEGEAAVLDADDACAALANGDGVLVSVTDAFLAACRRRWREFDGRALPAPVARRISGMKHGVLRAPHVDLHFRRVGELVWLSARRPDPHAPLPPGRMEVARLFADGQSSKDIARVLGLSPSTVRNQVAASYRDLRVSTRAGLKAALDRHAAP